MTTPHLGSHGPAIQRSRLDFQIGDRVRTTTSTWGDDIAPVGSVGTIVQPPPLISVAFDHDPIGDGTGGWAIFDSQLELVATDPTERRRLRKEEGEPRVLLYALTSRPNR